MRDLRRPMTFLFDFSGTLVNDVRITISAIDSVILETGGTTRLGRDEFKKNFRSPYWQFLERFGVARIAAETVASKIFQDAYLSQIGKAKMFPDVRRSLLHLKRGGAQIGIVSNTPRSVIAYVLEAHKMKNLFDIVIGLEDCEHLKPSPLPIIKAVDSLGRHPGEVAYVGDMVEDIVSAREAGAIPIIVWRGYDSYQLLKELKLGKPALLVTNLAQVVHRFRN